MKLNLTLYQTRVLAVLIEKEITTPDQYPLSINALVNGCNQKSSREPVLQLDQSTVQDTIDELKALRFIREESGYGSRVVKLKHRFCNTEFSDLKFSEQELAIICVLFLRGPQSPGELRTRTNRLCSFTDVNEVESALASLAARPEPLVIQLNRESGKRDSRWAHLFSGEVDVGTVIESTAKPVNNDQDQRITDLEQQVKWLKEQVEKLNTELGLDTE
jgi:uncharacterized protein YceH (UPF0502 family)